MHTSVHAHTAHAHTHPLPSVHACTRAAHALHAHTLPTSKHAHTPHHSHHAPSPLRILVAGSRV
eukprot:1010736-Rhodomonas_salina.1